MAKTTIFNDTGFRMVLKDCWEGVFIIRKVIPIGGKYTYLVDTNATYCEYKCNIWVADLMGNLSSDDFAVYSKVRVYLESTTSGVGFTKSLRSAGNHAFNTAKDNVSSKIHAALGSCTDLKELLRTVRLCRNQCDHLVQIYEEGIHRMNQLHSTLLEDSMWMWRFYRAGRLTQIFNSLDSLEYIVCDVKDLLGFCTKEVQRMALVVSSMSIPPDDQKGMEVCSKFGLLVGELMWNFDLIEYQFQPEGAVKLEWCLTQRRYVLNWIDGSKNSVGKVKSAVMIPDAFGDFRSHARMDREDLLSTCGLNPVLDITTGPTESWYKQCFKQLQKQLFGDQRQLDILREFIVNRCKVEMHADQNPSNNIRSLSVDLKCFEINHLDLKLNTGRVLGSGSFKNTYEGKWCGQRVAISTLRNFDSGEVENELKQLIGLQHPKVVSFYGWAYTENAPPPIKTPEEVKDNLKCQGYYIVTEKMECDLEDLINGIRRATTIKRDSGGPFSLSVGLDILLQIVEAMLHVHKYDVMHRDIKPKNFLVNSRSSPRSGDDKFYDVKLIDFGASKLFVEEKNTCDKGTTRYEAPEMMKGKGREGDVHGKYGQSVDVFSFAMTCYQVITGVEPFQGRLPRTEILNGKRPVIPATILSGLKELMEACWVEDRDKRPTFEQIQERLWTIKMELVVPLPD